MTQAERIAANKRRMQESLPPLCHGRKEPTPLMGQASAVEALARHFHEQSLRIIVAAPEPPLCHGRKEAGLP